ncbi:MAG: preprotein translocase subunit SecY [Clostridia bacterium]|nr:preprotein translocase subunit SecY [Clostridia bacterium]
MWETLRNAWRVDDVRKKIIYTMGMLLLFRLLGVIPVPGIDLAKISQEVNRFGLLDFMNNMTGGALERMTVMAMGITPYINASIIMQLLTVAIPALERMQKEGDEGRKKLAQWSRYLTVVLAFLQAVGMVYAMSGSITGTWFSYVLIGLSMAAGTSLAMWIGERITENGIGNGISLLIFAGIVSRLFTWSIEGVTNVMIGNASWLIMLLVILGVLGMIIAVTFVDMGERRVPVQYAKRVQGRKMYGGQSTHIPMKVNSTGVLPLIFAYSLLQFPGTILAFWPNSGLSGWWGQFQMGAFYQVFLALLIFGFTFFYSSISFNPVDISKNMQQYGGTNPGIRQGRPTTDFLSRVSKRLTLFGAMFLALLATIPTMVTNVSGMQLPFAASSLLIAVSVAIETTRQLESQMLMRHYKGFL